MTTIKQEKLKLKLMVKTLEVDSLIGKLEKLIINQGSPGDLGRILGQLERANEKQKELMYDLLEEGENEL